MRTLVSHLPLLCVALLGLGLAAGCSTPGGATGTAPSDGFPAPDKDYVFDAAATALAQQDFSPDREASSKQTWTIVSHWKTSLSPFSGRGYRDRATVTIHDVPGKADYYYTETQVVRQFNDNMQQPSNPIVASWGRETRVGDVEAVINRRIEMNFLQGDVSARFRSRYGLPSDQGGRLPSGSFQRVPDSPGAPDSGTAPAPFNPFPH